MSLEERIKLLEQRLVTLELLVSSMQTSQQVYGPLRKVGPDYYLAPQVPAPTIDFSKMNLKGGT